MPFIVGFHASFYCRLLYAALLRCGVLFLSSDCYPTPSSSLPGETFCCISYEPSTRRVRRVLCFECIIHTQSLHRRAPRTPPLPSLFLPLYLLAVSIFLFHRCVTAINISLCSLRLVHQVDYLFHFGLRFFRRYSLMVRWFAWSIVPLIPPCSLSVINQSQRVIRSIRSLALFRFLSTTSSPLFCHSLIPSVLNCLP